MSSNSNSKGFFATIAGVFTGTEIFATLKNHSFGRVVWHTFLFLVLLSLLSAIPQLTLQWDVVKNVRDKFKENFGATINVSGTQATPAVNPERSRLVFVASNIAVGYVGSFETGVNISEDEFRLCENLLIWGGSELMFIHRVTDNDWVGVRQFFDSSQGVKHQRFSSANEIINAAKNFRKNTLIPEVKSLTPVKEDDPFKDKTMAVPVDTAVRLVKVAMFFAYFLLNIFVFVPALWSWTILYALFFRLLHWGMSWRWWLSFWKIGLYASFPCLTVAAVIFAFELPFLRFDWVYIISSAFFWNIAARRCCGNEPDIRS